MAKEIVFQTGMKHKDLTTWAGNFPLRRLALAMKLDDLDDGDLLPYGSYLGGYVTIQDILTRYSVGSGYHSLTREILALVIHVCHLADEASAQLAQEQQERLNHPQLPDPELELLRQRLLALRLTQAPHGQARPKMLSRVELREFNPTSRILTIVDPDVQRFAPDIWTVGCLSKSTKQAIGWSRQTANVKVVVRVRWWRLTTCWICWRLKK